MPINADSSAKLLLVEGLTDKWAVRGISHNCCEDLRFAIHEKRGLPSLIRSIQPECKVEGRDALGLVVDADQDPQGHWDRIRESLGEIGIPAPIVPNPEGTLIETAEQFVGVSRIGIWIMPDNRQCGGLEDFLIECIKATDMMWVRAQHFIDDIPQSIREFEDKDVSKAKLHAWLSTRKLPGRLELAVRGGNFDTDCRILGQFALWLSDLFS